MPRRTPAQVVALCSCAILSLLLYAPAASAQAVVTGVVSRMTHGAGGQVFDLPLPQTAPYGIECRAVANGMAVVVSFDRQLTAASATVVGGGASVAPNNGVVVAGSTVTINLVTVLNQRQINVRLTNVADQGGGTLPTLDLFFRTLLGDCNASGSLTVGDVNYHKMYSPTAAGQLHYGSFRADVDLSGTISAADVAVIKTAMGTSVAGGPQPNSAPTLTNVPDQSTPAGTAVSGVGVGSPGTELEFAL